MLGKDIHVASFQEESIALQMRAISIGNAVFDIAYKSKLLQESDRKAVAYAMQHEKGAVPLFTVRLGTTFPSDDFAKKCFLFAPEKIQRALQNHDISSHVSRDENAGKWGGGIVITVNGVRWGIGFSGEKEWEDEGLGIVTAQYIFGIRHFTHEMTDIMKQGKSRNFVDALYRATENHMGVPEGLIQT